MATGVRVDVADGVGLLTLDGAERLNVFTAATGRALGAAYRACEEDPDVRVVVLTGAGRAFCAGADLAPGAGSFDPPGPDFSASPVRPPAFELGKLVVAAVNGPAIGIGLTLALQADVRIVAEDARLAVLAVAADLLLTGRPITGVEAAARGIASRALPAAEVLPAALDLAREVAAHADPAAVALSKRMLWSDLSAAETEEAETDAHRRLLDG